MGAAAADSTWANSPISRANQLLRVNGNSPTKLGNTPSLGVAFSTLRTVIEPVTGQPHP